MENKDIVVLVLPNGDQLICTVQETTGAYLARDILQIVTDPDVSTGQMRMMIVPYLSFCDPDGGVAIPTSTAIVAVPNEELLNHYNTHFGNIITPPSKKIILG